MPELRRRRAELFVAGRRLENIDFSFELSKQLSFVQNTMSVTIYNLSKETRKYLHDQLQGVDVVLFAGYEFESPLPLLGRAQLRQIVTTRQDAEWVTTISSGDGDLAKLSPITFSAGPGSFVREMIQGLAKQFKGVNSGNINQVLSGVTARVQKGFVVHGVGGEEVAKILTGLGYGLSIQDGEFLLLPLDGSLQGQLIELSPESGLHGSPERSGLYGVNWASVLMPSIRPGTQVRITSENLNGIFVAATVNHRGDTVGGAWTTSVEGRLPGRLYGNGTW